jgi:hypothetical protein
VTPYILGLLLLASVVLNMRQFIAWLRAQADLDEAYRRLETLEPFG